MEMATEGVIATVATVEPAPASAGEFSARTNRVACPRSPHLAASQLGLYITPLNYHLTAGEVTYILKDSDARLLIADQRYGYIKSIMRQGIITYSQDRSRLHISDQIDRVVAVLRELLK